VTDNLRCIFKSEPEDVITKRKHRAWLEDYINGRLAGRSESHRRLAAAAVKGFYEKNDGPLFGRVTIVEEPARPPPRALKADDIRRVLKALPLGAKTPLLCVWQSGMEINRTLALRWGELQQLKAPLKLTFYGRKKHKKAYFTFLGGDAVEHLMLWREKWEELAGTPKAAYSRSQVWSYYTNQVSMKSSGQTLDEGEAPRAFLPPSDVMRSNPADPSCFDGFNQNGRGQGPTRPF
jgi:integrase